MDLVARLGANIPLQARKVEMERLRAALRDADSGTASAVLLAGDAGVGKSRLVSELLAEAGAAGFLTLVGRCLEPGGITLPYLPFSEAFEPLAEEYAPLLRSRPALGTLLPVLVSPPVADVDTDAGLVAPPQRTRSPGSDLDTGQLRLFDAVLGLLGELAQQRCVLLVVEDLHWADESSRHLLQFLVSRLRAQRLLILATYRTDDLHRRHPLRPLLAELVRSQAVERIELGPLGVEDTRALVLALADRPLPQAVVEQIAARSEGNPFFAEELLVTCIDCGDEVPEALADVLLARVERLSPGTQEIVRLASVHGRRIGHDVLQAVAGPDPDRQDLDAALRDAVQRHVLVVDGDAYAFRHALLQEAVYGDLLPGERVRLHARYADYLAGQQGRGVAAALAHHSLAANALPQAFRASVAASTEAERQGAPAEALHHTEQALQLWDATTAEQRPEGIDEMGLLRRASALCQGAGEPERSLHYARTAVRLADASRDPEQAARSRWRLAQALLALDDPDDEAPGVIEHAWRLVVDAPPGKTRAWVLAVHASLLRRADPVRARQVAEQALADAAAIGNGGARAEALSTLGLLADGERQHEEAARRFAGAIGAAAAADSWNAELRARNFLALHHYELGALDESVEVCAEGVARAKETGMSWSTYGLELRVMRVMALYAAGDWDAIEAAAHPPRRPVSDTVQARIAAAGLHLLVGRGRFAEAESMARQLRGEWHRDSQIALYAGGCAADLAAWRGEPGLAAERVADLLGWWDRLRNEETLAVVRIAAIGIGAYADLGRAGGDPSRHRSVADELLGRAEQAMTGGWARMGVPGPEARAWLAMARAEHSRLGGDTGDAGDPALWQAAVTAFGYGEVYREAVARWRYAAALLGAGRRDEAAEQLAVAGRTAHRLAARPLADAITGLSHRARLTAGAATRAPAPDVLTPRERAVLALVARGRTNRQAGEELYISEKTVSVHLSRVMAKLGVNRRAEAVAAAYERGLLEPDREAYGA